MQKISEEKINQMYELYKQNFNKAQNSYMLEKILWENRSTKFD